MPGNETRASEPNRGAGLRVAALRQTAREVHYVPVDFTRDSLDEALAAAGHDPGRPTTWVWEGVIMYLTPAQIDATLAVIARRSAAGSRLIVVYHSPARMLYVIGLVVGWLGEPLRSAFEAVEMRGVLARHRFEVVRDHDLVTLAAEQSADVARAVQQMKHLRTVTADYRPVA